MWRDRARDMMLAKDHQTDALKGQLKRRPGPEQPGVAPPQQAALPTAEAFLHATERVAQGSKAEAEPSMQPGNTPSSKGTEPAVEKVDWQYLRNVIVKYLSTSPTENKTREQLLPAISVLLELAPDELIKVREVQSQVSSLAPIRESAGGFVGLLGATFNEILS